MLSPVPGRPMRTGVIPILILILTTVAACSGEASPDGTGGDAEAPFTLTVTPPEEPPEVRMAIPGQRVPFLVEVESEAGTPVTITASATGATVQEIILAELTPGEVGEVWVVPDPSTVETTASVTITGTRGEETASEVRSLPVFPMVDERGGDAERYFRIWVDWLEAGQPELGITAATEWDPEFVSTLLVVSHYAYFSDEWEMTVAWHNMIPPDDWTEVHLRRRFVEARPSLAFRMDSVDGMTEPHPVEPPEVVVR